MYRAAVCTELGKPLVVQNVPRPTNLPPGQVRIAVHKAAVNFADNLVITGKYQERKTVPFIPGFEAAGEVTELGPGVSDIQVGDKVCWFISDLGGFAEEAVVPTTNLMKIPNNMDYNTAAAFPVAYGTAEVALKQRANLQPGETVLVTNAAGGVGLAAVDLVANVFRAKVIGAAGSREKCDLVKQKGAIDCIDYRKENVRERVKQLTNGQGADVILDIVGGDVFKQCLRCIAFEGRIVIVGFASGEIPQIPANILLLKNCSVVGVYLKQFYTVHPDVKPSLQSLLEQGIIRPHISKHFSLNQINEALKAIVERNVIGRIIIDTRPQ